MELCQGDITKKPWVLWHVTYEEAIEWSKFLIKRRYEWLEIIGRMFGGEGEKQEGKKCRDKRACRICRKWRCVERIH